MPFGVVRAQLYGARRVFDGAVVFVQFSGVLGHALVVFTRAFRFRFGQTLEHLDGCFELALLHEHLLEPEQ